MPSKSLAARTGARGGKTMRGTSKTAQPSLKALKGSAKKR
jgi:hypothetical protein